MKKRTFGVGPIVAAATLLSVAPLGLATAQRHDPFGERYYQGPPGSGVGVGTTVRDLTTQLALEARRLVDDLNYELAGTSIGPQALAQAVSLNQSLDRCDELASRGGDRSSRFRSAVLQVEPSLQALRTTLNRVSGAGHSVTRGMSRIGRLYGDLRQLSGVDAPGGGPPDRPGLGGQTSVGRAAQHLAEDVTRTQLQLQASGLANYSPYNRVARDLVTLGSTIQGIVELIERRARHDQVLAELSGAQSRVDRINSVLGGDPNVPAGLRDAWDHALQGLSRLAAIVANDSGPPPPPIVINPPVVIPPVVRPPTVLPPLPPAYGGALAVLDQWLAQVDQLVAVQQAMVATAPQGFVVLGDARELRSSLQRLRQRVGSGAPPPALQGAFRQVERDYGTLRDRIDRIAGGRSGPNIDLVRSMRRYLEQFRAYAQR